MKHNTSIALILSIIGIASATQWTYDDPTFFQQGPGLGMGLLSAGNISPLEIINSPYFSIMGKGYFPIWLQQKPNNTSLDVEIKSTGNQQLVPPLMSFDANQEKNLGYAQKSSFRVGKAENWNTLNGPYGK
jgi:hypothetical protein